jgi:thymidylate synthase (FAD)
MNHEFDSARITVPALDEILGQEFKVLDHGFVRVVDYMGGDSAVVQAARVSYGKGTKKISQDRGLIRYLLRHRHTTPFEMCEIKLHIKLPIFIARQWIRHRTASVNEYSARYSLLDNEYYVPDRDAALSLDASQQTKESVATSMGVIAAQSSDNKQGRGEALSAEEAAEARRVIAESGEVAYATYLNLLNENAAGEKIDAERAGLARELARIVLPTSYYTQWYWKIDLHNLLHFLSLRLHKHAQLEIRAYAEVIADIVSKWVPLTWEAFLDYRKNSVELSAQEFAAIKEMLSGLAVDRESSGLSDREWKEFSEKFDLPTGN